MAATRHQTGTASTQTVITEMTAWAVRETAGATAQVNYRAQSSTGTIVLPIQLAANESVGDNYGEAMLSSDSGGGAAGSWYVEVASGTVRWTISGR